MSKTNYPINYEPVQGEDPAPFTWIVILKLLIAAAAIPVGLALLWLIILMCYWLRHGQWPGWDATLGG